VSYIIPEFKLIISRGKQGVLSVPSWYCYFIPNCLRLYIERNEFKKYVQHVSKSLNPEFYALYNTNSWVSA
jgi:hypothetical protein